MTSTFKPLVTLVALTLAASTAACAAPPSEAYGSSESRISGAHAIGDVVVLTGDGVRLRTGPGSHRTAIASLYKGTTVELLAGADGDTVATPTTAGEHEWYRIKVLSVPAEQDQANVDKEGWIAGSFLDGAATVPDDDNTDETRQEPTDPTPPADGTCEKNDTQMTATRIGDMSDADSDTDASRTARDVVGEWIGSRERWYRVRILDESGMGNPVIRASVTASNLDVTVVFACANAAPSSSTCGWSSTRETSGNTTSCQGETDARLNTHCEGTNVESGEAFVRVRKKADAANRASCSTYTLHMTVN